MGEIDGLSFSLNFAGFDFGPLDTIVLVVSLATAIVSSVELIRLSGRDRLQQRVAELRGAVVARSAMRPHHLPWYNRLGATIAKTPLVGAAEQRRLTERLAAAGISGAGRLATFIAVRVFCAVVAAVLVSLALTSFNLLADSAMGRYFAAAFGMIIGWRVPDVILTRLVQRRKSRLELGFPDALDMLVICAEAGLGLEQAMGYVSRDLRLAMPEVAEEFSVTEAEMRVLADRRLALENLAARTGLQTLRSLVTILNQSVRFGTPLSDALRQMTAEARYVRMSRIEERAGRLSVTLLLPVMVLIMPCLFIVICGPIALRAIDLFGTFMSTP